MSFLENIKAVPITDFAERIGYRVIRCGQRYVTLKEHDSVRIDTIKNCFWRNSRFGSGAKNAAGSIIDFAIEFNGAADYKEAMRQIAVLYGINNTETIDAIKKENYHRDNRKNEIKKKILEYPERAEHNDNVVNYLLGRSIDRNVIEYFLDNNMLYQDIRNNAVFRTNAFCCLRSTGKQRFVQDRPGCNYEECFYIDIAKNNKTLIVAESVIDVMSIMSFLLLKGRNFRAYDYLALSGTNKNSSVKYHVDKEERYENIVLCYDNDEAGDRAMTATIESLKDNKVNIVEYRAKEGKDWNDYLSIYLSNC